MSLKDILSEMSSWESLMSTFIPHLLTFGLKLIGCIVIYFVGRKIIKALQKVTDKMMMHKRFDPSIASFVRSLINIVLMVILIYIIVDILGITTTSFLALFASIGVALGMALSGTLQNFAGGVMILLFRPFKVGDSIDAQGQSGTVKEIQIFNTVIITSDNRTVFIPNGGLSTNVIFNYNNQDDRRAEWVFSVAYGTDLEQIKQIILDILISEARILPDPKPGIVLKSLNSDSIDIQVRVWTLRGNYWDVYYAINEQIYRTFKDKGIQTPSSQMTVLLEDKRN